MKPWNTLERKTILDHSKFLRVEEHRVELPSGEIINDWSWVITPDYVNVVVITEQDEWICFRQTKYAVEGTSLALVGGYLESGEDPLTAAKRETLEETGYEAPEWISMGKYAVDGNRGSGNGHFFLALNAHKVAEPDADDLEEQELLLLSQQEVQQALLAGEFKVLAWCSLVGIALLKLQAES